MAELGVVRRYTVATTPQRKESQIISPQHPNENRHMKVAEVVTIYTNHRKKLEVAEAASTTISQCSISPSLLVDAFNAAILDLSRSDEEAAIVHAHRNELLSHFNSQE